MKYATSAIFSVFIIATWAIPALAGVTPAGRNPGKATQRNSVILIIRHAEKADDGPGLTTAGQRHAMAYVRYFRNYRVNGRPVHLDAIIAARDSAASIRPRLTVEPLDRALRIPIDTDYKDTKVHRLASNLLASARGHQVLICWRKGEIPDLITALGANPESLLPGGAWPDNRYNWVVQVVIDGNGHVIPAQTRRVVERF